VSSKDEICNDSKCKISKKGIKHKNSDHGNPNFLNERKTDKGSIFTILIILGLISVVIVIAVGLSTGLIEEHYMEFNSYIPEPSLPKT